MILPSKFPIASINLIKSESVQRSTSRGGNIQIGRRTSSATELEIESAMMPEYEARQLVAFLDDVGLNNPFTISPSRINALAGTLTGNLSVRVAALAGSKVISVDGAPSNLSEVLKPHDMLNFSGHDKAYFVGVDMTLDEIDPINANASGQFELRLSQPLRKNVANNEIIDVQTPNITVLRTSESTELSINAKDSNFATVSFTAIEFI